MKKLIITSLLSICTVVSSCQLRRFKVEITYCDQRGKDTIFVDDYIPPNNNEISTYKQAVPEWNGRLNVCNLKVLSYKLIK